MFRQRAGFALAVVLCLLVPGLSVPSTAAARFDMATDTQQFYGPQADAAFESTKVAGASTVRIHVAWSGVAPGGRSRPAGFDAGNPANPHYDWSAVDAAIRGAGRHGLAVVADQFHKVLAVQHVEPIAPEPGTPFDPSKHEAIMQEPSHQYKEPTVTKLLQKGYALRDRTYFLPLDDRSWPDDTLVEFDAMDDPQPRPSP